MKTSKRLALVLVTVAVGLTLVVGFTSGVALAGAETSGLALAPSGTPVLINEMDTDQVGTDSAEFVELYDGGVGSTVLDGLVLVFYNGNGDVSYAAFDLDGFSTDANGYYVLCGDAANVANCDMDVTPDTNLIQNGEDAVALYVGDATSFPNSTPVTTANLVDAIVYDTDDPDDPGLLVLLNPGQPQVNENGGGNGTAHSNQRCPNGSGGARNTDTYLQLPPTSGALNCPVNLSVDKTGPAVALPGDIITYTILYTNSGPGIATNAILTDTLPAGVTYLNDNSGIPCTGCTPGSGSMSWAAGLLGAGADDTFQLTALISTTVPYGTPLTNTITITATEIEGDPLDNSATVVTLINPFDLSVDKTGDPTSFAGENVLYTIQVENMGVAEAEDVVVTDTLPVSTTFVAAASNAVTTTVIGGQVVFEFDDLIANTLETIILTVTVDTGVTNNTVITNHVTASTLTAGDNQANNTDQWETTIYTIVPIATARAGNDGEVFAVEGQVIYAPGTFNTSGWALQDASGGIGVFYSPPPAVSRNDVVRLMATRGSFMGEEQFVTPVYTFTNFGPGAPVSPVTYTTNDVNTGLSEGWLVQIEGTISGLTSCSGNYDFSVDDGSGPAIVFVDQDIGVDVCALGGQDGDFIRVTGFSTEFNGSYEVKPRDPNDVQLIQAIPVLFKDAPSLVAPGELFTYTLTLQNFIGYTLTNIVITDVVPTNADFAYGLDGGTETGGLVTWNVGALADQGSLSMRFAVTATLNAPTLIVNDQYAITASNYATTTFGAPVNTLVMGAIGPNCGDPAIFIHDVQGSGSSSSIVGVDLAIEGVVVGDYQAPGGGYDGFFVQEEDAEADANPMTSEGLFVYDNTFGVAVQSGDVVRVFGTVAEFNGLTELNQITDVQVCAEGAVWVYPHTVTPASVTLPIADLANWEWIEGMLLNIPNPLYVTEVFGLGRYGEVSLSVSDRLDQPTQVTDPGANALALQDLNDRSRVQLNDAQTGQNPDPIIYPSPELSATNTLRGGDSLPSLTGVLNYSFGTYLIEPVGPLTFTHIPRPPVHDPLSGTLKIASFNLLNYFSTIDDGNPICGPAGDQDCRGANSAEEFTRQRDKIINAILEIDADILGLIEIENHPDDEALDDLISGLNAIAGAGTYASIGTGTIGTDAIKVAFIYKPATVTPVGDFAILDDTFDPGYHDDYNRPALAQTFQEDENGETVNVVINHFKSKGSDCDALGDPDTGDGQGNCNLTRLAAAEIMLDWLATDPTGRLDPDFLILGDLNSYAMEDPITALVAGGFTDLFNALGDAYSYVFDGQWGTLDYGLANASLLAQVAGVTAWHINADEPPVLDYNVEFKTLHHVTSLYSPDAYRASDHDPIIVSLSLTPLEASFFSNSPVVLGELSVFTSTVNQSGVSYAWDFGDGGNATDANPTHTYAATGTYTVTLEASNGFLSVTVIRPHVVLLTLPLDTNIYLPIIIKPDSTSAVDAPPRVQFISSGFLLVFAGMGGVMILRRKQRVPVTE